jgi:hypothetical protein
MTARFIADANVGKLARWLRLMGYDTEFFAAGDDAALVARALQEGRTILSRDTRIMQRRLVKSGRLRAVLLKDDRPENQVRQVVETLGLDSGFRPFTLCLECNQPLAERSKAELAGLVPPYVYQTQEQFMQCPQCRRIYWRGTHWRAMVERLKHLQSTP